MKGVALFVAVCSLVVSLSLGVVIATMRPPAAPAGVCVDYDEYGYSTDGAGPHDLVHNVTSPTRVGGVLSCARGRYVSVTP